MTVKPETDVGSFISFIDSLHVILQGVYLIMKPQGSSVPFLKALNNLTEVSGTEECKQCQETILRRLKDEFRTIFPHVTGKENQPTKNPFIRTTVFLMRT